MRFGSLLTPPVSWPITMDSSLHAQFPLQTTLYQVALQWLVEDRDHRRKLEQTGWKTRGARRTEVCLGHSYVITSHTFGLSDRSIGLGNVLQKVSTLVVEALLSVDSDSRYDYTH